MVKESFRQSIADMKTALGYANEEDKEENEEDYYEVDEQENSMVL